MLAILSPTPAAVNNTPKEANNCGNIENTPIAWNILLVSSTASDGLALVIANKLKINISKAYVATDFIVLMLSLIYIPFGRIVFSMLTTVVSSFIIGQFEVDLASGKQSQTI